MKAHIARNQNAGVPLALGWNLSAADRGILEGMAPAFGMKLLPVSPYPRSARKLHIETPPLPRKTTPRFMRQWSCFTNQ